MSILIKLREAKKLSNSEDNLRNYILKNSKDILYMSIHEMAIHSYCSASTIVRLCQQIGLSGFKEFKIQLAAEIKNFENLNINILDSTTFQKTDTLEDIIDKVTNISIKSIEETNLLIDKFQLKEIAEKIIHADILDFYGSGASNIIAFDASYKFMRIGKNVCCLSLTDRQRIQAVNSNKTHFAIIISYSGETQEMVEIAKILQQNNVPTLSITSSSNNTIMNLCDYNLLVSSRESLYRNGAIISRTSTLYIIDLLYTTCIQLDYNRSISSLKKTLTIPK